MIGFETVGRTPLSARDPLVALFLPFALSSL
jgi:hypothetical protein